MTHTQNTLSAPARPLRILMIDDDNQFCWLIKAILEQHGHKLTSMPTGAKGLQVFHTRKEQFDVVLLDFLMPGLNGAETLRHLRRMDPRKKVILITGAEALRVRRDFEELQVDCYLSKPVTTAALLHHLHVVTSGDAARN